MSSLGAEQFGSWNEPTVKTLMIKKTAMFKMAVLKSYKLTHVLIWKDEADPKLNIG